MAGDVTWLVPALGTASIACVATVWWVFDGYGRALFMFARRGDVGNHESQSLPAIAVLLTVHNEESSIDARLRNLLESDYPSDRLRVVVASDRSTDRTVDLVKSWARRDSRVHLCAFDSSRGKSDAQNMAVASIDEEIVVYTDADTRFEGDCLRRLAAAFHDPRVGGADAELRFESADGVAASFSRYWNYERRIRELESRIGTLAVASGACVAIRRSLIRPIPIDVGEDCVLPLMVVSQGRRMVVAQGARAWDRATMDSRREFRARVRMTLRNWRGTWGYPELLNPARRPAIALSLWSHKVLRWLSLPLLATGGVAGMLAVGLSSRLGWTTAGVFVGVLAILIATPWPGRMLRHFLLANLAFAIGVAKAIVGHRVTQYRGDSSARRGPHYPEAAEGS